MLEQILKLGSQNEKLWKRKENLYDKVMAPFSAGTETNVP